MAAPAAAGSALADVGDFGAAVIALRAKLVLATQLAITMRDQQERLATLHADADNNKEALEQMSLVVAATRETIETHRDATMLLCRRIVHQRAHTSGQARRDAAGELFSRVLGFGEYDGEYAGEDVDTLWDRLVMPRRLSYPLFALYLHRLATFAEGDDAVMLPAESDDNGVNSRALKMILLRNVAFLTCAFPVETLVQAIRRIGLGSPVYSGASSDHDHQGAHARLFYYFNVLVRGVARAPADDVVSLLTRLEFWRQPLIESTAAYFDLAESDSFLVARHHRLIDSATGHFYHDSLDWFSKQTSLPFTLPVPELATAPLTSPPDTLSLAHLYLDVVADMCCASTYLLRPLLLPWVTDRLLRDTTYNAQGGAQAAALLSRFWRRACGFQLNADGTIANEMTQPDRTALVSHLRGDDVVGGLTWLLHRLQMDAVYAPHSACRELAFAVLREWLPRTVSVRELEVLLTYMRPPADVELPGATDAAPTYTPMVIAVNELVVRELLPACVRKVLLEAIAQNAAWWVNEIYTRLMPVHPIILAMIASGLSRFERNRLLLQHVLLPCMQVALDSDRPTMWPDIGRLLIMACRPFGESSRSRSAMAALLLTCATPAQIQHMQEVVAAIGPTGVNLVFESPRLWWHNDQQNGVIYMVAWVTSLYPEYADTARRNVQVVLRPILEQQPPNELANSPLGGLWAASFGNNLISAPQGLSGDLVELYVQIQCREAPGPPQLNYGVPHLAAHLVWSGMVMSTEPDSCGRATRLLRRLGSVAKARMASVHGLRFCFSSIVSALRGGFTEDTPLNQTASRVETLELFDAFIGVASELAPVGAYLPGAGPAGQPLPLWLESGAESVYNTHARIGDDHPFDRLLELLLHRTSTHDWLRDRAAEPADAPVPPAHPSVRAVVDALSANELLVELQHLVLAYAIPGVPAPIGSEGPPPPPLLDDGDTVMAAAPSAEELRAQADIRRMLRNEERLAVQRHRTTGHRRRRGETSEDTVVRLDRQFLEEERKREEDEMGDQEDEEAQAHADQLSRNLRPRLRAHLRILEEDDDDNH